MYVYEIAVLSVYVHFPLYFQFNTVDNDNMADVWTSGVEIVIVLRENMQLLLIFL
jgi:hypothetical protein